MMETSEMEKTDSDHMKQEQKPSKDGKNKDVRLKNIVEDEEENGEANKEDHVHEKDQRVVTDHSGKNVAEILGKNIVEKDQEESAEAERRDVSPSTLVRNNSSAREEIKFLSHLKEREKKALAKLKAKIEEVIRWKVVVTDEDRNNVNETTDHEKKDEAERREVSTPTIENSLSSTEDSNFPSDWQEYEKKALAELKVKVEKAIHDNDLLKSNKERLHLEAIAKSILEKESKVVGQKEESTEQGGKLVNEGKAEEKAEKKDDKQGKDQSKQDIDEKKNLTEETAKDSTDVTLEKEKVNVDKDIALWGVPLLPSKGDNATDVILMKFLRAKEFKVNDAFEMLRNTLHWRRENNIDSILEEKFDADLQSMGYINGLDCQGRPVCYNNFELLGDNEIYNKILGTEEKRETFLRWRVQMMEKGIQKLDFKPGGVSSLLQISDVRDTPGPSKKELRMAIRQLAIGLSPDNYPEIVAKNIFINVPFWFYAFTALLSPFLTQRTRSKFVFARPARVTETLLKYIPAEEIPVRCGGLKRENDSEFSNEHAVMEVLVKAGSTENVEIPVLEAGITLIWDLYVSGWEVNYKEEFVPSHEESYTIIVQRERKMGGQEGPVRNSFKNKEPGKVVLVVENLSFKKKRVLYRYKIKNSS